MARSGRSSAFVAGERQALETMLDESRELIRASAEGLTEDEARRRLVPSRTTILGIIQHTAAVERFFFQRTLSGLDPRVIQGLSDATDVSWELSELATITSVLDDHQEACETSRAEAAQYALDHVTPHNQKRGPVTLRWIYLHMIGELARHAGHADILREQILADRPRGT